MAWLNARGRDATGLITIFDLTGDYMLLEEAEERFPENPRVVIAVAQLPEVTWNKELIEHLRAVDPQNPEWIYQELRIRSDLDYESVIAVLRKAATLKGRRDNHLAERMQRLKDTCLVLGVGPRDAMRITLDGKPKYSNFEVMASIQLTLSAELAAAKACGSEDRAREIIALGLITAEKFSAPSAIEFGFEAFAAALKLELLEDLPDDMMIGTSEKPVGTIRAEAEERILSLRSPAPVLSPATVRILGDPLLKIASDEVALSYFDLYMKSGETAAGEWLYEQSKKAQGTEAAATGDAE